MGPLDLNKDNPPKTDTRPAPLLKTWKSPDLYWRELVMMSVLLVFFTLVLLLVEFIRPASTVLTTTIGTLLGGVSGALLAKLRQ